MRVNAAQGRIAAMAEDMRERPLAGWRPIFVAIALVPPLYFLSSGPALQLTLTTPLPVELWNFVYWPLTLARDIIPGFHEVFQSYLDLWTR
jgi:hypothetical protein